MSEIAAAAYIYMVPSLKNRSYIICHWKHRN